MRIYQPVEGPDRFPQAMVEGSTEYDWADMPDWLQDKFRDVAREFTHWAVNEQVPLKGELANEREVEA